MDPLVFHTALEAIKTLNASEGPSSNIFEPKFEARRQAEQLRDTVLNAYRDAGAPHALAQLCRCLVFIGTTMMEVEEEEEGYTEVRRAYEVAEWYTKGEKRELDTMRDVLPTGPATLLSNVDAATTSAQAAHEYRGCAETMAVLNALGLYLSKVDLKMAETVLNVAEKLYTAWSGWWADKPAYCTIRDVPLTEDGVLRTADIASERVDAILMRFYMDSCYTATLFFKAQLHTALQNTAAASEYCHRTMYYQLLTRQEYSPKSWAANALQLSGFYSSRFAYDKAYHCLQAGQAVMPPSSETAEAGGLVAWAFGRFYLHRLHHYGGLLTGSEPSSDDARGDAAAGEAEAWRDFPGMPPLQPQPPITNFDEARECFKHGIRWLQEAQDCRPFETCCTEHIDVARDMVQLYAALQTFEPNRARRIAMMQRQAQLLERFPEELSFNAYPVVVRQLLYDLGSLYEDQMRLRVQQRKDPQPGDTPLKDKPFNALVRRSLDYYTRFCETWRHPTTQVLPDVLDEENRLPFFRSLMRQAQVQLSFAYASPKEEYDGIGVSCKAYTRAIEFYERNPLPKKVDADAAREVELAREMVKLLPVKQRDLWAAFQRSSS